MFVLVGSLTTMSINPEFEISMDGGPISTVVKANKTENLV